MTKTVDEVIDTGELPTEPVEPSEPTKPDESLSSSILDDIKKMIGLDSEYDAFDVDIIVNINSAFFTLYQLGVGPKTPFNINDNGALWNTFSEDTGVVSAVKQYIYLKVRQVFDPPATSAIINQYASMIQELEWRLRELASGVFEEDEEENPPDTPPDTPTEPDDPGECPSYTIATDEQINQILDDVFGKV